MSNLSDFLIAGIYPVFRDANYTAKSNELVWVDTSGSALTITLPASPNPGANVRVGDSAQNATVNNITIDRNGNTINGLSEDFVIDENNGVIDLIWNGTTWAINVPMFGTGGLTEAQVANVASGKKRIRLRPEGDLSRNVAGSQPSLVTKSFGGTQFPAYRLSPSTFNRINYIWTPPPSWDGGPIRWRLIWVPSTTAAGEINCNLLPYWAADNEEFDSSGAIANLTDTSHESVTKIHISPWSAETTPPFDHNDFVALDFYGRGGSPQWTTSAAADVIAIELEYTTNVPTDD